MAVTIILRYRFIIISLVVCLQIYKNFPIFEPLRTYLHIILTLERRSYNIMTIRRNIKKAISVILVACVCQFLFAAPQGDKVAKKAIKSTLSTMSVRSKVAQLIFADVFPEGSDERKAADDSIIVKEQLGGIILMEGSIGQTEEVVNRLQSKSRIPLAVSIDGEFGVGMRVTEFEKYPRQGKLAKLPNDSLIYEMGRQIAEDMHSLKIDINFAPVVDVNVHPETGSMKDRSFGPDKHLVAEYGSAFMRGMQDNGVIACAKHFPGHGDTATDSHHALPVLDFPMERLDTLELYPFRRLMDDGVEMVMVGHLQVPALDSLPASVSYNVITGLLRKRMNYEGIITTDALNMKGVLAPFDGSYERAALGAYIAGADILLMPKHITESIDLIVNYIGNDPKKLEDLDRRVSRILMMKIICGKLLISRESTHAVAYDEFFKGSRDNKLSHKRLHLIPGDLMIDPAQVSPAATSTLIKRINAGI